MISLMLPKRIKLYLRLLKISEKENLYILFGSLALIILFAVKKIDYADFKFLDLFNLSLITSLLLLYVIKLISDILLLYFGNAVEDYLKLEINSNRLIKKYPLEKGFVKYNNKICTFRDYARNKSGSKTLDKEGTDSYEYMFPVVICYEGKNHNIIINDNKDKEYKLPNVANENYISLFKSHSTSDVYNQTNIRLDDFKEIGEELHLFTSRTTFYDSLVTNRAMDFELQKGITLRNLTNPGPFIIPLDKSQLSNHIGYNVFIKTLDGDIIFVKRSKRVSIGKSTLGPSIAASLKTRYCLNENLMFTLKGLEKAVEEEVKDELGIDTSNTVISVENNLIAIYRDILEGGKPQFLFRLNVNYTSAEVELNFKNHSKKKNDKYDTIMDGNELVFVNISELSNIYIAPDVIFFNKKKYNVLPSVAGILAYFINNENDNTQK